MTKRICLGLDLQDDSKLIEEYTRYHEPGGVWPEIIQSLYDSGIVDMEIYLLGNRLFMILEAGDTFSLERKANMDRANEKVQQWELLMRENFQQALPWEEELRWVKMDRVFKLGLQQHNM
jgi:L-rhamnose mutarotase